MRETRDTYDCIVIGGGPAGATAAALLADYGHRTIVLEKSTFPRHHIGESLMPQTYSTFKRLGLLEKLRASDFPTKESVQFVSASGKDSQPFFFTDRDPHESSITWQVKRDEFDRMMLDNARDRGAEVCEGVRVRRVLFDGDRAVGTACSVNGETREFRAEVVIDATGQAALLSRQLNTRQPDPQLKNAAIYAYFKGAIKDAGRNAGATIIIRTPGYNGWFWFIPLPDDTASVGVVGPPSYLCSGRGDDPLETLEEEIAACPGIARRLAPAERISRAYVSSDFSSRSTTAAGDGWLMIGDALGFIDPVYSSGVMLALKSGEFAADTIHDALQAGDPSAERLEKFAPPLIHGMQLLRQLVYAFYDPEFNFGDFLREYPQYREHLVRLLIGDVFNNEVGEIFGPMSRAAKLPEPVLTCC